MTLTHLLPSLRRTLPDPFVQDDWPEFTTVGTSDVTVAGLSLVHLVDWCGTPCVHNAAAVIPGTSGRPSETEFASVIVTRVTAVERTETTMTVWVDAEIEGCAALVSESRLIGRVSTAHSGRVTILPQAAASPAYSATELPWDLCVGDLIAIPCRGFTALHDVRGRARHPERLGEDRLEHERDQFPLPHCVR
jgi:hypothetical protein